MLNITISKIQLDGKYVKCNLNLKSTGIVGLTGKISKAVVDVFLGKSDFKGNIQIDNVSLKEEFDRYIKYVSYFSGEQRKNFYDICVNDYMDLFGVLEGLNFDKAYEKMKMKYLKSFGLRQYIGKSTKELGVDQMACLEFLCGFLNQPKLIVIDHYMNEVSKKWKTKMYQFILEYVNNMESLCVIMEFEFLTDRCNKIVNLDDMYE